jgi:hypothetical protein
MNLVAAAVALVIVKLSTWLVLTGKKGAVSTYTFQMLNKH